MKSPKLMRSWVYSLWCRPIPSNPEVSCQVMLLQDYRWGKGEIVTETFPFATFHRASVLVVGLTKLGVFNATVATKEEANPMYLREKLGCHSQGLLPLRLFASPSLLGGNIVPTVRNVVNCIALCESRLWHETKMLCWKLRYELLSHRCLPFISKMPSGGLVSETAGLP